MIDWFGVFHNALWIFGLAIVLAALSYADWRRRLVVPPVSFRQALAEPGFQAAVSLGFTLFCAGLALGSAVWWQIAAWAALGLFFAWNGLTCLRRMKKTRHLDQQQTASASDGGES